MEKTNGVLKLGRYTLSVDRPLVMGVVNVTPDSFSDGGLYLEPERALARLEAQVAEGADLLDIGGLSTRPGSEPVTPEEELRRVLPVVREAVARCDVPISVDTYRPSVAAAVLAEGASVINDVMGIVIDPGLVAVVAGYGAGLIIMHIRGVPPTMQADPVYLDLMGEIRGELVASAEAARAGGVARESIVIDPGIGFGKTLEHNLEILRRLDVLTATGYPVMIGPSRKSFIGRVLGLEVGKRLMGTVGALVAGYHYGARLFRVHDVAPSVQALRLAHSIATGQTGWAAPRSGAELPSGGRACGS